MRKIDRRVFNDMSLQTKVSIPVVASVLIILSLMTWLYLQNLSQLIVEQYEERTIAYVRSFDNSGYNWEDYNGSARLQANIENLLKADEDLYRITVYSIKEGKPFRVASTVHELIGKEAAEYDVEPILTNNTHFFERVKDGESVIEILAPLHVDGIPAASIGLYFRLAHRDSDIAHLAKVSVAIGMGGAFLLLLVLRYVIRKGLLQPIIALETATRDLGAGLLDRRINILRGDELGKLAEEFNLMAATLEQKEKENLALQRELEERFHEAKELAGTDALTGLCNHRSFQERLTIEISRAQRMGHQLSILFLDLDHFKAINDTRGHQTGDIVLRQLGGLIKNSIREMDIAARYGGEEFTIILPETGIADAYQLAERLRISIAKFAFEDNENGSGVPLPSLTVSIGVACYPFDAIGKDELISKVDLALYCAKELGRNQVRLYEEVTYSSIHK